MSTGPRRKPGPISAELASVLREHLARRRMSQRELARRTEISPSQISRYFKADVSINVDELDDICKAMDLQPDTVLATALHNIRWRESKGIDDPNALPTDRAVRFNTNPSNFPPREA